VSLKGAYILIFYFKHDVVVVTRSFFNESLELFFINGLGMLSLSFSRCLVALVNHCHAIDIAPSL
jgi:hypothetical protein